MSESSKSIEYRFKNKNVNNNPDYYSRDEQKNLNIIKRYFTKKLKLEQRDDKHSLLKLKKNNILSNKNEDSDEN